MEIIDELNEEFWSRGDPNDTSDYQTFRVMQCEKLSPQGTFAYGVFADDGMLHRVIIENGISTRDPLRGACNIQLRLAEDDDTQVIGVIIEDDCVLLKSAIKVPPEPEVVENGQEEAETNGEHVVAEDEVVTIENATLDDIFGNDDDDMAPRESIFHKMIDVNATNNNVTTNVNGNVQTTDACAQNTENSTPDSDKANT